MTISRQFDDWYTSALGGWFVCIWYSDVRTARVDSLFILLIAVPTVNRLPVSGRCTNLSLFDMAP